MIIQRGTDGDFWYCFRLVKDNNTFLNGEKRGVYYPELSTFIGEDLI